MAADDLPPIRAALAELIATSKPQRGVGALAAAAGEEDLRESLRQPTLDETVAQRQALLARPDRHGVGAMNHRRVRGICDFGPTPPDVADDGSGQRRRGCACRRRRSANSPRRRRSSVARWHSARTDIGSRSPAQSLTSASAKLWRNMIDRRGPAAATFGTQCSQSCWHEPPITNRSPWPSCHERDAPPPRGRT